MNIEINNFGIIKNANIDIVPLNIFIGSNSSGKSFTARLIHCFNCNDMPNTDEELTVYLNDYLKDNDNIIEKILIMLKANLN